MGNQQSTEKHSTSRSATPQAEKDRKISRKPSVQALSHSKAQPIDPSAANANATAQGTTSHNAEKSNLQNILASTSPESTQKSSKVERSSSKASKSKSDVEQIRMSSAGTVATAASASAPSVTAPTPTPIRVPESTPSTGIDIPLSARPKSTSDEIAEDYLAYQERHYAPISHLRPPRLPLPIADARVPDSPTLMPVDQSNADVPIFDPEEPISATSDSASKRRSSFTSEATQEEEEIGDELQPYAVEQPAHTVPTTIEWNQPGERVFVTGTFATWERKYRLHKRKSGDGMSCIINLPPGTHHLKFWVDNQMVTSPDLPTAVDFNNVLVNYIEINADDIPRSRRDSSQPTQKTTTYPSSTHEEQDEMFMGGVTPGEEMEGMEELAREELPPSDYRGIIPQYLIDIEYPEEDPRYRQAADIIQDSNGPPTLPLFLNRSILNGNTPVKDDSSVLTLPNHTVLNHLMTSSVKNGVLATSVTHRYKKKYVTTISFKPVPKFDHKL